jgi:DNA-binding CsgD family transcriptional regulator
MSKLITHAAISDELLIVRCGNGVKLLRPENSGENQLSVGTLMELPLNVYFLNNNSENCALNKISAQTVGWDSQKEALGKAVTSIWPDKYALSLLENDAEVVKQNKMKVLEEEVYDEERTGLQALSFKFPWYDADNNIVGVFGCTIAPDYYPFYSLGNSLAILAKTQLLNAAQPFIPETKLSSENYFTKREMDVLRLTVRAKTSKEIATHLGLSYRTVEHYLENAKRKIGVSSKSELIEKIIDVI